ncbi:hypothetical protein SUGI_0711000 [Cryptomeria japonica]|nr:hypothetical protein SUGI_0711000 [Cryptomeria japonica]
MAAASASASLLCIAIVICSLLPIPSTANREVDALIDVKKMILQDPSNALETWVPSSPNPCNWMHVTCDAKGLVDKVYLPRLKLYGALSPRIGDLETLTQLDLFQNSLFGILPSTLGNLKKLIVLHLGQNQFTGPIPQSIGQLSQLQILSLEFNKLTGRVPTGGKFSEFGYDSFQGNPDLCGDVVKKECPRRSLIP